MSNPCLDAVIDELEAASVPYKVETDHKHIHIRFGAANQHLHVVAKTPSDHRAHLNERALIRRELARLGYVDRAEAFPISPLVTLAAGEARCASYHVAEHFSKAHKDVLRAIDRIREECGPEFDRRNFTPVDYVDAKGRTYRAYSMTRDGFTLVVMGFTGSAATVWKVKYIDAFNALEREVLAISNGDEIKRLRDDLDTAVALIADFETRIPGPQKPAGQQFIRPSVLRKMKKAGGRR